MLAQGVVLASGLLVTVVISRLLGPEELGRWRLVGAIFSYAVVFSDLGLSTLAIREIARRPVLAREYGVPVVVLQLATALVMYSVIAFGMQLAPISQDTKNLGMMFGLIIFPQALSLAHVLQATERMQLVARIRIFVQVASSVVGLAGLYATHSLVALVVPIFATQVVTSAWIAWRVRVDHGVRFELPSFRWWGELLGAGMPFLLTSVALLVILNADAIILGVLRGERELGLYSAAYVLASQLLTTGGPIMAAVYPRLAALSEEPGGGIALVRPLLGILGTGILPIALGGAVLADKVIAFLYGAEYQMAVPVLITLMALPAIGYYNTATIQTLSAGGHQRTVMNISFLTAATNIALNILLISFLGILGAAIAMVVAEVVAAVAYTIILALRYQSVVLGSYLESLPAALFMSVVVLLVRIAFDIQLIPAIAVGAVTYGATLAIFPTRASRISVAWLTQRLSR
jgi:O-antigen/teichoic acid export membrane protein